MYVRIYTVCLNLLSSISVNIRNASPNASRPPPPRMDFPAVITIRSGLSILRYGMALVLCAARKTLMCFAVVSSSAFMPSNPKPSNLLRKQCSSMVSTSSLCGPTMYRMILSLLRYDSNPRNASTTWKKQSWLPERPSDSTYCPSIISPAAHPWKPWTYGSQISRLILASLREL